DYGTSIARTTFGIIGVKVWVYHGDEIPAEEKKTELARARALAGVPIGGTGAASRGALITDVREIEDGAPIPPAEPRDAREEAPRPTGGARPSGARRPTGGKPGAKPGTKPRGGRP